MLKQIFIIIIYLLDHRADWIFFGFGYLIGKLSRLRRTILSQINIPCYLEIHYLREEIRRLKFANSVMRQELNRAKQKRPCLCKKLQIIYFKLRFEENFVTTDYTDGHRLIQVFIRNP
ncbi:MAG: hypothetical protein V1709_11475 [Planctomycetota bacterium]